MSEPATCRIYYFPSSDAYNQYFSCPISRWQEDNWNVIIETFLESGNRNSLFANVIPGAVREIYNILGTPKFIDISYSSGNTLIIEPQAGYGISSLRQSRTIGVKNIQDTFLSPNYFSVKIEGVRL